MRANFTSRTQDGGGMSFENVWIIQRGPAACANDGHDIGQHRQHTGSKQQFTIANVRRKTSKEKTAHIDHLNICGSSLLPVLSVEDGPPFNTRQLG